MLIMTFVDVSERVIWIECDLNTFTVSTTYTEFPPWLQFKSTISIMLLQQYSCSQINTAVEVTKIKELLVWMLLSIIMETV